MNKYAFSPFLARAAGVNRLVGVPGDNDGPAYDIVVADDDNARVTLSVPGYTESDLVIEAVAGLLTVSAEVPETDTTTGETPARIVHRGIRRAPFKRVYRLAEHVEVKEARLDHGLLHIDLNRKVPEALKPRKIQIEALQPAREAA